MTRWYYSPDNKQRIGPLTADELRLLATAETLRPDMMVLREGDGTWLRAAKLKGLFQKPSEAIATARRPLPWQAYIFGVPALLLGILALPSAIIFSSQPIGVLLATVGLVVAVFAVFMSYRKGGAGLGLVSLSLFACASALAGAIALKSVTNGTLSQSQIAESGGAKKDNSTTELTAPKEIASVNGNPIEAKEVAKNEPVPAEKVPSKQPNPKQPAEEGAQPKQIGPSQQTDDAPSKSDKPKTPAKTNPKVGETASSTAKSALPDLNGNEQEVVRQHIVRNADDASSVEIAEWLEPRRVLFGQNRSEAILPGQEPGAGPAPIGGYKSGVVIHVRWREKNRLGAKVLREGLFLIQNNKLVNAGTIGEGLLRGVPRDQGLGFVMAQMGSVAAQRIGNRVTVAVIHGTVTQNGAPMKDVRWVLFRSTTTAQVGQKVSIGQMFDEIGKNQWEAFYGKNNRADIDALHAALAPPRYELSGVLPGQYSVTVEYEGKRASFSCVVNSTQEIQRFDFDVNDVKDVKEVKDEKGK